ncbi:hypothetical protein IJ541_09360 [bacterium]|nr:hypothetical protein [bacterium]
MDLLHQTDNMLNDKPVTIPFSALEFRYKLIKIRELVDAGSDKKAKNAMNKILKESMRFANKTTKDNIESQKEVLGFLHHIFKKSPLKYNEQLKELLEVSKSRLDKQEIIIPFKRKSFIYDLEKIVHDIKDTNRGLYEQICTTANKLPTSDDEISAYILKLSNETNNSIGYKLVWPSMATVEHLWPRSKNGLNVLPNVAIASAKENSGRKSIDFTEQLVRRPKTPIYLQRQINKLVSLNNSGIFHKHGVQKSWLSGMSDTIYDISAHQVKLDLSKLAA